MDPSELEDRIFERLMVPRIDSAMHLDSLGDELPVRAAELAAVGLDTNVLKQLRRDVYRADNLLVRLAGANVRIIVPKQVVVEFWNNHRVFAKEDWNQLSNALRSLKGKLDSVQGSGDYAVQIANIESIIDAMAGDLAETQSDEYLSKSKRLIESLLPGAVTPMVSRGRFGALAQVRQSSKFPPGFADDARKVASWGDIFVWLDFLLGVLFVKDDTLGGRYLWVTQEAKEDWKTGSRGHPSLLEEFAWISEEKLSIVTLEELEALLEAEDVALLEKDPEDDSTDDALKAVDSPFAG